MAIVRDRTRSCRRERRAVSAARHWRQHAKRYRVSADVRDVSESHPASSLRGSMG